MYILTSKQAILFILFLFSVKGDESITLENGKTAFCREKEDCPEKFIHSGSCSCEAPLVCCINSGKAQEKCNEYAAYVYKQEYGFALTPSKQINNVSDCHLEAVPLIIGGVKASEKEFPHMVIIGFGDEPKKVWMCGGSLISDQHVLSAAHCINSRDYGPAKWAKIGLLDLYTQHDDSVQQFTIIDKIAHPGYKPPSRYNDIAIFKLDPPVTLNGFARPACLNVEPTITVKKALASGWGKLEYTATNGSESLMKVVLNMIDSTFCNNTYKIDVGGRSMGNGVIKSQLCAGELEGGKDTCQGDSGGPLQTILSKPFCMYSIIGVTSFGKFCGFKNAPAIYTRVSHYVPWIESVVWP